MGRIERTEWFFTVDLVKQEKVDTLLLPLSWWDLFPHQLAHSNQDAWARGLQVNLLAANTHLPSGWSSGSGIYSSDGHRAYYHDVSGSSGGKLVIADLDIKPNKVRLKSKLEDLFIIIREKLTGPAMLLRSRRVSTRVRMSSRRLFTTTSTG